MTPLILYTLSSNGFARWNQVNIFSQPPKDESIFHHIANNYLSHFSIDFLFLKGDIDMPGQFITRHSVRGIGELYLFQLPLLILGFWYLFKKRQKQILIILAIWILLYPIGSMFTTDKSVQATRSIIGVIPFQIFSAIGLYWGLTLLKCFKTLKNIHLTSIFALLVITVIITISFINFLNLYFVRYPLYSSDYWGWQYGQKKHNAIFFICKK